MPGFRRYNALMELLDPFIERIDSATQYINEYPLEQELQPNLFWGDPERKAADDIFQAARDFYEQDNLHKATKESARNALQFAQAVIGFADGIAPGERGQMLMDLNVMKSQVMNLRSALDECTEWNLRAKFAVFG